MFKVAFRGHQGEAMQALIDGDIVAYRCAASVKEDEPMDLAIYRVDVLIQQIIEATDATSMRVFVKGKDNFRYKIYPEYKANRRDTPDPIWRKACHEHLLKAHGAEEAHGMEADDMLGINQQEEGTVICSIDKDLRTIAGHHFNFVRVELDHVKKQDALRTFYKQMIQGDVADNIIGIRGLGPKKAAKLIDHLDDECDMFDIVRNLYQDDDRFLMNCACVWIMQEKNKTFLDREWIKELKILQDKDLENSWLSLQQKRDKIIM